MTALLDHDPAAEQAIVLALMAAPREATTRLLQANLKPEAFVCAEYSAYVRAAVSLFVAGLGVTVHTVDGRLREYVAQGNLTEHDYNYLVQLVNADGMATINDHLTQHIQRVATFATGRAALIELRRATGEIESKMTKVQAILPATMSNLLAISEGATPEDPRPKAILERVQPISAIRSGFKSMDEEFGGWVRGSVTTFAAPSGMGKTVAGVSFAAELLAAQGGAHPVVYLTPELPAEVIIYRLLANLCGISFADAASREPLSNPEAERLKQAWIEELNLKFRVYEHIYTVSDAIMRLRWHLDEFEGQLALFVLDHLHFMRGLKTPGDAQAFRGNGNAYWREVMMRFVEAAKTFKVPLLLFSQLSVAAQREIKDKGDLGVLAFKESGDIFDSSDTAWVMWRGEGDEAIVHLKKNRLNGRLKKFRWMVDPTHYRMYEPPDFDAANE